MIWIVLGAFIGGGAVGGLVVVMLGGGGAVIPYEVVDKHGETDTLQDIKAWDQDRKAWRDGYEAAMHDLAPHLGIRVKVWQSEKVIYDYRMSREQWEAMRLAFNEVAGEFGKMMAVDGLV